MRTKKQKKSPNDTKLRCTNNHTSKKKLTKEKNKQNFKIYNQIKKIKGKEEKYEHKQNKTKFRKWMQIKFITKYKKKEIRTKAKQDKLSQMDAN